MAHCSCLNNHSMWNGDGKPIIHAFRLDLLNEFAQKHPEFRLGVEYDGFLYECVGEYPEEELDCWHCDECHSLTAFIDSLKIRYDFARNDEPLIVKEADVSGWGRYIAMRDEEYERFMDSCEGMILAEAIKKFAFRYYCRASSDRMHVYVFDGGGKFQFGFEQKRVLQFP